MCTINSGMKWHRMAKPKSLTGEECDMHHFRVLSGILLPWEMVDTSQHFAASVLCEANKSIAHLPSKCDQQMPLSPFANVRNGGQQHVGGTPIIIQHTLNHYAQSSSSRGGQ